MMFLGVGSGRLELKQGHQAIEQALAFQVGRVDLEPVATVFHRQLLPLGPGGRGVDVKG